MKNPSIHPFLTAYRLVDTYMTETPIYQTTQTIIPGNVYVSTNVYGGIATSSVTQGPSTSQYNHQLVGHRQKYFVRFQSDSGTVVTFEYSGSSPLPASIWLRIERQYWAFQLEVMDQPRIMFMRAGRDHDGVNLGAWISAIDGQSLNDATTIFNLKLMHFDFREFMKKIGKESPQKFAAPEVLQKLLDDDIDDARRRHAAQFNWSDARKIFGGRSGKIVNSSPLNPRFTIDIGFNKAWLIAGPALSLLMIFFDPLGLFNSSFWLRIPGGATFFNTWWFGGAIFITLSLIFLLLLSYFMDVRRPKRFFYDKNFFINCISEPFDPSIHLGGMSYKFSGNNANPTNSTRSLKPLDEKYAEVRLKIHRTLSFNFSNKAELLSQLKWTKITNEETQYLLNEIEQTKVEILTNRGQ